MSFYGSNLPPSLKLPQEGGKISGVILEIHPERQATKFQTPAERQAKAPRVPATWPNGDKKMEQPIVLQLAKGSFQPINPNDTGKRTLRVTKGDPRYKAIRAHYLETGQEPEVGFDLEMEFTGTEPGQGANPKHIYVVTKLEPAAEGGGGFFGDDVDEQELVTAGAPATSAEVPRARPRSRAAAAPPSAGGAV